MKNLKILKLAQTGIPVTLKQELTGPNGEKWYIAIFNELNEKL